MVDFFRVLSILHTDFLSVCTHLKSHQQWRVYLVLSTTVFVLYISLTHEELRTHILPLFSLKVPKSSTFQKAKQQQINQPVLTKQKLEA